MRPKDESKELAIREKAIQMIVEEGFDGLSMHKLAKAANVSPATIYIYFENREDLLNQLYIEVTDKIADATLKDFDPNISFEEGLWQQWERRYNYLIKNPLHLFFMDQFRNSPLINKPGCKDNSFSRVLGEFYMKSLKRKEVIDVPMEIFWSVAYGPLYTLLKFHFQKSIMGKEFDFSNEKLTFTFKLVLKALKR